ncbi:S-adenosyl-L-methionine-dependent methyltransferase [Gilbertella persicaria]|nr:S-adenosyl-L-methionine-dependent methyltransferase [Gilbertella persicaria]KAI8090927.1 S-adenosyl-L-methionine-dependent methyltransferase [Gilbertella persicaria]
MPSKRDFHDSKSSTYWLPKDDEEQDRLTGQHFAVKELFEGNMLTSVAEKLDFTKNLSILDVGCGSGSWLMDMASDYPQCTFEGCDIVEVTNKNIAPPQVHFCYGDVLKGLEYSDNSFDFVHMRLFILALRENEWPAVIKELIRVTKPGGIIQLLEIDLKKKKEFNHGLVHIACAARGQDPRIAIKLDSLLAANDNIKVVQTDYRSVDMASNTATAKKFLWDWKQTVKSMMPVVGPKIGLATAEEQQKFIKLLVQDATTSGAQTCMNGVAAQKLHE